jgi:hypothetical protein
MHFAGAQQTCFSDWGRTAIEFFPTAKFNIAGEVVHVFRDDKDVGHYDFSKGTGFLEDGNPIQPPTAVGRFDSFAPIDVDTLIQK